MRSSAMHALLVHNDNAGTNPIPRARLIEAIEAAGITTTYCSHLEDDIAAALSRPIDMVIAAGGDGTVADVVSTLVDTATPIGILPLGGSNNIAHAMGVEGDWQTIPGRWSLDAWTRLDRCEAKGPWGRRPFVEGLGSGVLTDAFDDADEQPDTPEEKQENGRAAFRRALEIARPFECKIETPDWSWSGDCLMVEAMNIPYIGARLALATGAVGGDGLLDLVIVTPDERDAVLEWSRNLGDADCPIVPRRTPSLRLTVHERPFRVDDRSPDENLAGIVDIRVRRSWVKVLVPQDAGHD